MLYTWTYVENDLLVALYRIAKEQKLGKDFTAFVFEEIKRRNLRVDKPRQITTRG